MEYTARVPSAGGCRPDLDDAIRAALLAERARLARASRARRSSRPGQMTYGSQAAAASQVFAQQRDLALRDRTEHQLELVDEALARLDAGTFGTCVRCGQPDRGRSPRGAALGRPLHRLPAARRPRALMTDDGVRAAPLVTIEEIRAAAERLRGIAIRTPLVAVRAARATDGSSRPSPSSRSARSSSAAPTPRSRRCRPEAASRAASSPTRRATMPRASPERRACSARRPSSSCRPTRRAIKRERVAADGAEIVIVGTASDERQQVAEEIAAERGLAIIPPFDDDRIIAGQGTVGLEIVEDLPDLAAVLVPIGGGGLASGVATAIRALRPERARHRRRARAGRRRARIARRAARSSRWPAELVSRTIADGTRTQALGGADVRPSARLPRLDRHGLRGRDRGRASGWPPNAAGSSSSHPARWASRPWRSTPREAGLDRRRWADRRRGQRRERRPGRATASYLEAPIPPEG